MNGNPINQIAFSVPPTIDLHAFCTLLSYNDRVTVTITVDANLFSEAQCNAMLEAFNEDLTAIVRSVDSASVAWCVCGSIRCSCFELNRDQHLDLSALSSTLLT